MNVMEDEDSMVSKVMAGVFVGAWLGVQSFVYWDAGLVAAIIIGLVTAGAVFWLFVACSRPLQKHRDRLKYILKYRLKEDGIKCEVHEDDLYFFEDDLSVRVSMKDSVCRRGVIRMSFTIFKGIDGKEDVPYVGLSALANDCTLHAGPAHTVFNGTEMVLVYEADVRTLHDFDEARDYAVTVISRAVRYLENRYPEVYAFYNGERQSRSENGSMVGFEVRHDDTREGLRASAKGRQEVK